MDRQKLFQSRLAGVGMFAERKHNILTEQEIKNYFEGIDLTADQWNLVYSYLETLKIHIAGRADTSQYILMPENKEERKSSPTSDSDETEDTDDILSLYLEDLKQIAPAAPGEEDALFKKIVCHDQTAVKRLAELYLYNVIAIAQEYGKGSIPVGDLIQEGNMGLLTGISMLPEKPEDTSFADYLIGSIREAMEIFILEQGDQTSLGKRVEEKVNRLNTALKELEEDLGHKVTKEELSVYLDMPLSEIEEVKRLAGDELGL